MEQLRVVADPASDMRSAMEKAGHLLAQRPRSEHELRVRLRVARFEDEVVDAAVDRLRELRLVDDGEFARQWVAERSRSKTVGAAVLEHELRAKGVAPEVIAEALGEADLDEPALAHAAALRYVRRLNGRPLRDQYRKVVGHLLRRGFEQEVAGTAARSVLPPEGWD